MYFVMFCLFFVYAEESTHDPLDCEEVKMTDNDYSAAYAQKPDKQPSAMDGKRLKKGGNDEEEAEQSIVFDVVFAHVDPIIWENRRTSSVNI